MNTQIRGVNDIPSRMSRTRGSSARSQNATLLARLEQQKSLLEKQLHVWNTQKARTEDRLRILGVQLRAAQQALKQPRTTPATIARKMAPAHSARPAPKRVRSLEFTF
jgi:hypothetical protein